MPSSSVMLFFSTDDVEQDCGHIYHIWAHILWTLISCIIYGPIDSKMVSWFPALINADLDCDRQETGESGPSLSTISLRFTSHLVMFSVSAKKSIGELKDPKPEFVCLAFARLTHRQWWRAYWEVSALKLVWR